MRPRGLKARGKVGEAGCQLFVNHNLSLTLDFMQRLGKRRAAPRLDLLDNTSVPDHLNRPCGAFGVVCQRVCTPLIGVRWSVV